MWGWLNSEQPESSQEAAQRQLEEEQRQRGEIHARRIREEHEHDEKARKAIENQEKEEKNENYQMFINRLQSLFEMVEVKQYFAENFIAELKGLNKPLRVKRFTEDILFDILDRHQTSQINLKVALDDLLENREISLKDKAKILRNLCFNVTLLQPSPMTEETQKTKLMEKYQALMKHIQSDSRYSKLSDKSMLKFNINYFDETEIPNLENLQDRVNRLEYLRRNFEAFARRIYKTLPTEQLPSGSASSSIYKGPDHKRRRRK